MTCSIRLCDTNARTKGWCDKHYQRWKHHGSPNAQVKSFKAHGKSGEPEYKLWVAIKQRCYNPKARYYHNYGGKGITMCDRWLNDYETFINDIGQRPYKDASIDRIDGSKGYTPENCRWVDRTIQSINQRLAPNNTSGYRGVSWFKAAKAWRAYITAYKQRIDIGYFSDKEEAAYIRDQFALVIHGSEAKLNVLESNKL
jgi:hypothetical protein